MSDDETAVDGGGTAPQPASGPMDESTASWYVEYTGGQFQAFERNGHWYLHMSSADGPGPERSMGSSDG